MVIDIKQTSKLKVTGISGKVTWKSSNKSVVSVDKKGVITGQGYGSTVITASVAKKTFKCRDMVYSYRDSVKNVATKYYLSDLEIWDKPYRIRFTYELRSSAEKNYMCMNINDGSDVYYHEMAHYYHLDGMDYGCQISAWTEGLATALAADVVKLYDEDKSKASLPFILYDGISEAELEDFENYFINVGYEDCYTIGYYFIRFIQKEYGESVVLEINDNIKNNISKPEEAGISPSYRKEASDKLFLETIKNATSDDVFTRFVDEDLIFRMKERSQFITLSHSYLNKKDNIIAAA